MTTEISIEAFSSTEVELKSLVEDAEYALKNFNIEDEMSLDLFKSRKKDLQKARLDITETGKKLRAEALQVQKGIIAQEKQLLEFITPTEDKMKAVLERIKQVEIEKERVKELPERISLLDDIGDDIEPNKEHLLSLDHDQFVAYLNERKATHYEAVVKKQEAEKREADQKREAEEAKQREVDEAVANEKKEAEVKLQAEKDAKEKAERELVEAKERQEREAKEAKEKAERELQAEEARLKKETEDTKYQEWLNQPRGDGDFKQERVGNVVQMWKLVDTFTFDEA